jgi:septum formation protein
MVPSDIILASASPRRRELLDQLGIGYEVMPAAIDESPGLNEKPEQYVRRVAAEKSWSVWEASCGRKPVLAADTEVELDGEIFGKPRDLEHAIQMLGRLSGREHRVLSAVSLRSPAGHSETLSISTVSFRAISPAEMVDYWATGEPCDKAGAYAIQGKGALFVRHLAGSYSGVMGLPLFETAELLKQIGLSTMKGASHQDE